MSAILHKTVQLFAWNSEALGITWEQRAHSDDMVPVSLMFCVVLNAECDMSQLAYSADNHV